MPFDDADIRSLKKAPLLEYALSLRAYNRELEKTRNELAAGKEWYEDVEKENRNYETFVQGILEAHDLPPHSSLVRIADGSVRSMDQLFRQDHEG